jgi:hypothetical protein
MTSHIEIDHAGSESEIRKAVIGYMSSRSGIRIVTMSDAVRHVRTRFPMLGMPNSTLVDIIAGEAIVLGLHVELDGELGEPAEPTFERPARVPTTA